MVEFCRLVRVDEMTSRFSYGGTREQIRYFRLDKDLAARTRQFGLTLPEDLVLEMEKKNTHGGSSLYSYIYVIKILLHDVDRCRFSSYHFLND